MVGAMASNMKQELVQATYDIIKLEGVEGVKIRRVAQAVGCTSTVIYKHFEDVDHLIAFASVKFMENYIRDFQAIWSGDYDNMLDMNLRLWECFATYAFNDIDIFEPLFWGKYKERLGDMLFEHYQLDNTEMKGFDGLMVSVLFNEDLREREYMIERRAAATGYLNPDDIDLLSDMANCLFHGMLLEYKDKYKEPGMAEEGVSRFVTAFTAIMNKFRLK